jgi:hypothetical protein
MGYAHYWERIPELSREGFLKASEDIRLMFDTLKTRGVQIAGPNGAGEPELTDSIIAFNGVRNCGHRYIDLGEPWPAKIAEGVANLSDPIQEGPSWFSGPYLLTRTCGGSCAGKPFIMDRNYLIRRWEKPEGGRYFCHCETAFRPYDLAVTCALLRVKERLGDEIVVSSDGYERGFNDAKRFSRELFGLPQRFELKVPEPALGFSEDR